MNAAALKTQHSDANAVAPLCLANTSFLFPRFLAALSDATIISEVIVYQHWRLLLYSGKPAVFPR